MHFKLSFRQTSDTFQVYGMSSVLDFKRNVLDYNAYKDIRPTPIANGP